MKLGFFFSACAVASVVSSLDDQIGDAPAALEEMHGGVQFTSTNETIEQTSNATEEEGQLEESDGDAWVDWNLPSQRRREPRRRLPPRRRSPRRRCVVNEDGDPVVDDQIDDAPAALEEMYGGVQFTSTNETVEQTSKATEEEGQLEDSDDDNWVERKSPSRRRGRRRTPPRRRRSQRRRSVGDEDGDPVV